jgi:hypothetical protein
VIGGHGELFVQEFDGELRPKSELLNATPPAAAAATSAKIIAGSGARKLVDARGWGEARDLLPSAANALRLPEELRTLPARPVYARAPDARAKAA